MLGGTAAAAADDDELNRLLDEAKRDLARRAEGEQAVEHSKDLPVLAVPLRLDTSSGSGRHLLELDSETGMARLNASEVYAGGQTAASAEFSGTAERPDPTVRRMRPGELARAKEQTAGKRWFGMKAPTLTPELKNDLRVLQLRSVLDPKRFYKKTSTKKELPKYFETGTIVEGPTEFYSSRMTKKERRNNLVDELLADKQARSYFKRKVTEIHKQNVSGGKNWYRSKARGVAKKPGAKSKPRK
ncbi:rrna-processing protein fcf2 [Coemansia javaensis]|uniref:Rrna-processing protein fcf2 n=1 Tax=Coemansia javaensis TaxID=2761396 RepID=A0A9W8HMM5_9FUNG|nr:rrna-processing protein fcf2 [Coemansia javaensis]